MERMRDHVFFNPEQETMDPEKLSALQAERLRQTVKRVWEKSPAQRKRFQDAGMGAGDAQKLTDITRLPQMDKGDFRAGYPLAMSCVDQKLIAEMHMSSGSTGVPVVMPYTQADITQWAECMARCYCMAGIRKGDAIQITPSFGLFNGGFGFYHGARLYGLFVIPTGAGNTPRQIAFGAGLQDPRAHGRRLLWDPDHGDPGGGGSGAAGPEDRHLRGGNILRKAEGKVR